MKTKYRTVRRTRAVVHEWNIFLLAQGPSGHPPLSPPTTSPPHQTSMSACHTEDQSHAPLTARNMQRMMFLDLSTVHSPHPFVRFYCDHALILLIAQMLLSPPSRWLSCDDKWRHYSNGDKWWTSRSEDKHQRPKKKKVPIQRRTNESCI